MPRIKPRIHRTAAALFRAVRIRELPTLKMEFMTFYQETLTMGCKFVLPPAGQIETFLHHEPSINTFQEINTAVELPVYDSAFELQKPGYNERDRIYLVGREIEPSFDRTHLSKMLADVRFAKDGSEANYTGSLLAGLFPRFLWGTSL